MLIVYVFIALKERPTYFHILENIFEVYLNSDYWYIPTRFTTKQSNYKPTLSELQSNIVQVCLQTEGVGLLALSIGEKFKLFVPKALHKVLERAGKQLNNLLSFTTDIIAAILD